MRKCKIIYEIHTKDGEVVFRGTSRQCADYLMTSLELFYGIVGHTKLGRRNGLKGGYLARKAEKKGD